MNIGILTIGNELTSGRTQDTNSSYLAREFSAQGWQVVTMISVGDDEAAIKRALEFSLMAADALVVTGGLGPTQDDITTAAIARAFDLPLAGNEEVLDHLKKTFERFKLKWSENNAKQALFPAGAEIVVNPVGTAFGFALRRGEKVVVVIPGVPREVLRMVPEGVVPLLQGIEPGPRTFTESRTVKLFGLGEALVDEALAEVDFAARQVTIGFYPNFPENHLVMTARGSDVSEIGGRLDLAEGEIRRRLNQYIFASGKETLEGVIASLLTGKGLTLAVAESCTGGLISDRLTDVPGSSEFFEQAVVAYGNGTKSNLLGVPAEVLAACGAVSRETAVAMAEGVRRLAGVDLGLAVTGIAGPGGGTEAKPVGTVSIALADAQGSIHRDFSFRWDRRRNKIIASQAALILLRDYLRSEGV